MNSQIPAASTDTTDVQKIIEGKLLYTAYERKPLNLLMSAGATIILGSVLWAMFPTLLIAVWILLILVVAGLGYVECVAFQRAAPATAGQRKWQRIFFSQSMAAGAAWAVGPTLMLGSASGTAAALYICILLCVCAIAMVSVAAQRGAMQVFVLSALAPPAVAQWFGGTDVDRLVAVVLLCGMSFLMIVGQRFNQGMRDLLESQYRISSILDNALDAVVGLDMRGLVTHWNRRAEIVFGWHKDEAIGRAFDNAMIAQAHRGALHEGLAKVLEIGTSQILNRRIEFTALHQSGREFPVELSITALRVNEKWSFTLFIADITERIQTARALHASEERYRTLTEWSPEAICVHRQGRILYVNPAATMLLGARSAQELVGKPIIEIVQADYQKVVLERVEAVASQGGSAPLLEEKLVRLDGVVIDVEVKSTRIDLDGEPAIQVAIRDITERKANEIDLANTNRRLAALIEALPDPIFLKDGDSRWLIINEAAKQLFRLHNLPWQGKTEMELAAMNPAFRLAHETCLLDDEKAWQAGELCVFSEKVLTQDGLLREFEVRKAPMFDDQGARQALLIIGRDVTAQKQSEQALRIAATAFESQEGMLITNAAGIILQVNNAFTVITGYSASEAIGLTPHLLHSGRQDKVFVERMWEKIIHSGSWQGEIWNRRKNGEIYPEWLSITAVRGSEADVTHYVGTFTDISLRKKAEDEIRYLAFYDSLTELPNRRLLMDRLKQAMVSGARSGLKGALLFIDLDHFKNINDIQGHHQGDLLLQQVARRLSGSVRECDTVARLGGDEFVVMLEELAEDDRQAAANAKGVGEKILGSLNQSYQLDGHEHHNTASIGITLFGGAQAEAPDEPMKRADLAMYQAKNAGRNALRFFEPMMQAVVTERADLEADLHEALLKQQFVLFYQAQVESRGNLVGVEALLRWQHPRRGLVSPASFIPLAEESKLILGLGHWVLAAACRQLADWADRPAVAHLRIAVNVSARQFHHEDFVPQVLQLIEQTGANPNRLKLELTESLLVEDIEGVIAKMTLLRSRGISFSLDDFGTGYSSLAYLQRLPLDELKIDQGFIKDILTNPNDAAIAKMVVALGNSLGLVVIAEGVELEEQREFLANSGCLAYQGYLFGRPVPIAEFERLATTITPAKHSPF